MKRHLVALTAAAVFAAGLVVPAASADPSHAKNALTIQAVCGTRMLTVVTNGNGTFTPAHVSGNTAVFVPTAFNLTFTFTPAGGGSPQMFTDTSSRKNQTGNVTCTIAGSQTDQAGNTFTLRGTVTGWIS